MNKRTILILMVFSVLAISAFPLGIGVSAGIDPIGGLPGSNVMLSLKLDQIPFIFGLGFAIGPSTLNFGFTADWWALNQNLFSFVDVYVGPGLYLGYGNALLLGGRVPIGLNAFPLKWLEIFLEIAPTVAIGFGNQTVTFPVFGLQGSIGARFWFK